jgi:excisionase family DNA binding protein
MPRHIHTEPQLAYRVKDFCERIGISASTFWKYVKVGEIRVIRVGGRTLVPASEVERILSGEAA